MTLRAMLPWDVRLQVRYGFYAVYVVLVIAFAAVLRSLPAGPARETGLLLVLFADPSFLGFYFVAALVLFEKRAGVVDALVTSPLSTRAYLLSKTLSLTALALLATTAITLLGYGTELEWLPLLASVGLTSMLFVLVGFVAVARFDSVNAYFMTALVYMSVLGAPVMGLLGILETPLFYLLPAQASIVLLRAAVGAVPPLELAYAVGYLGIATPVALLAAERAFERHLVVGVQDEARTRPPVGSGRGTGGGPVTAMLVADLKNWARDPLLLYIVLAPVLMGLAGRLFVPYGADALAGTVDLVRYYPEVLAAFVLFGPTIIGFAVGFFVLEDREQGVLTALRTTPLTGQGYLRYRLGTTLLLGALAAVQMVPLVGLAPVPPAEIVGVAAVGSLWGGITALLLASLADTTVEGIAVSKFFGFLVMAPIAVIGLVPTPLQHLAGVFPVYWPGLAMVRAAGGVQGVWLALIVGAIYSGGLLLVLARRFGGRAD